MTLPSEEKLAAKLVGNVVRVTVNDDSVNEIIEMGFDRIAIERSIDLGVTWAEVTIAMDRPVLEKGKTGYVWIDRAGAATYLYRTKYARTKNLETPVFGDVSDEVEGSGLLASQILTVAQLKSRYLFGIDITDDNGVPMPDETFNFYILTAVEWFEHQLDIKLLPTTFVEMQDYYSSDYNAFNFIHLDNYPVISVESFSVIYPTGSTVIEYPAEWIRLDKECGHLRIVPTAGTLSNMMIGQGGAYLPAIYSGLQTLPHLFQIEYTAGFERIPANILDLIGKFASMGPFDIFGDLITGAGIGNLSLSMDGLSQSITTTQSAMYGGYGSRLVSYGKQIKEQIPLLRKYYKGIRMVVA